MDQIGGGESIDKKLVGKEGKRTFLKIRAGGKSRSLEGYLFSSF